MHVSFASTDLLDAVLDEIVGVLCGYSNGELLTAAQAARERTSRGPWFSEMVDEYLLSSGRVGQER